MPQDDEDKFLLQQLAPGNIVGVHNYCDSWCDRCGFSNRCVVNATNLGRDETKVDDPFLDHLRDRFDRVRTLVEQRSTFDPENLLKDVDIDAADRAEFDRDEARRKHRRRHDPILREVQAYAELVRAWFEAETESMCANADTLVCRAQSESVEDISLTELARLIDAIQIVRHDCFLIFIKLRRAVDGLEDTQREPWRGEPIQNDHNGSAKIALTCIDRSEGSWRAIDSWYSSCGGARLLADQLAALRAAVERRFPFARAFLRPGFDALVTPD